MTSWLSSADVWTMSPLRCTPSSPLISSVKKSNVPDSLPGVNRAISWSGSFGSISLYFVALASGPKISFSWSVVRQSIAVALLVTTVMPSFATWTSVYAMPPFSQAAFSSSSIGARGGRDVGLAAAELLEAVAGARAADRDVDLVALLVEELGGGLGERLDRARAVDRDVAAQVLGGSSPPPPPPPLPLSLVVVAAGDDVMASASAASSAASVLSLGTESPSRTVLWSGRRRP